MYITIFIEICASKNLNSEIVASELTYLSQLADFSMYSVPSSATLSLAVLLGMSW